MKRDRRGEFIDLGWEDEPSFYAVRGHVSPFDARNAILRGAAALDDPIDAQGLADSYRDPVHAWARWTRNGTGREYDSLLFIYRDKSMGAFPVTVMGHTNWEPRGKP